MRFARLLLLLTAASAMQAATNWDSSGNSMLSGTYYFRQVYYVVGYSNGDLSRAISAYGNIKFNGDGTYSITTAEGARYADTNCQCIGNLVTTGTYSIAASGYGFISSPYVSGDVVYGMVSAQGIFVGSSTENANGYNDMMVAAPVASPLPTVSSFTGSWICADFDVSSQVAGSALSLLMPLSPDGNGNLGTVTITGYAGTQSSLFSQTASGVKYIFSNGAAVATFPSNGTLVAGQKYFYFSKDGNFMFGGAPNSFDMIVGVKTGTTAPTLSGLYYQAGMDEYGGNLDAFYGSFNAIAGAAPQTFLGHERINDAFAAAAYDYTYSDTISLSSNGTFSSPYARYVVGAGGAVEITSGIGPFLGLSVALQAPKPSGTGVYLDPTGVVNSANSAPFTTGIAPGELLTLYGSNLAAATKVSGIPFLTTLGKVQVSIGGLPAAIYYVSATQISAIVPYGVTAGSPCGCVQIQVTNNGVLSNVVTEYVSASAPGVFTIPPGGVGYGAITHLDGTVVTAASPAHIGETIAVYLTGLGAVSPTVADGAPGPSDNLSNATGTFAIDFSGKAAAKAIFAGLAPSLSGLYQIDVTIPTSALVGDNYVGISGPDSYMSYKLIPIAAATSSSENAQLGVAAVGPPRLRKPSTGVLRIGGGQGRR